MAVNRTSTSLTRFLGAQLSVEQSQGAFGNVFRRGDGTQRSRPAEISRLSEGDLFPASVNIEKYHAAVSFFQRRGAEPNVIPALAIGLIDVAKKLNQDVYSLLNVNDSNQLDLIEEKVYLYLNQLRDATNQLGSVNSVNNSTSLIRRRLYPEVVIE